MLAVHLVGAEPADHESDSGSAIFDALDAFMLGAMGAAVDLAFRLYPVADHPAFAMAAAWGHGLNRAFEAVEGHCPVTLGDTERFVIVVSADVAVSHGTLLSSWRFPA